MSGKYKIIDDTRDVDGFKVYRIQALRDFSDVRIGELGGYIASGTSLSQEGNAWVYDESVVMGNAQVTQDARVEQQSIVRGNAIVSGRAQVIHSIVKDASTVRGDSVIRHVVVGGPDVIQGEEELEGLLEGDVFEGITSHLTKPNHTESPHPSELDEPSFPKYIDESDELDEPSLPKYTDESYKQEPEDTKSDEPDVGAKLKQYKLPIIIGTAIIGVIIVVVLVFSLLGRGNANGSDTQDLGLRTGVVQDESLAEPLAEPIPEPQPTANFVRDFDSYLGLIEPETKTLEDGDNAPIVKEGEHQSAMLERLVSVEDDFTQSDVEKFDAYYLGTLSSVDVHYKAWVKELEPELQEEARVWYEEGVTIFKQDILSITERLEEYINEVSGTKVYPELIQIIKDIEGVLEAFTQDISQYNPDELEIEPTDELVESAKPDERGTPGVTNAESTQEDLGALPDLPSVADPANQGELEQTSGGGSGD